MQNDKFTTMTLSARFRQRIFFMEVTERLSDGTLMMGA